MVTLFEDMAGTGQTQLSPAGYADTYYARRFQPTQSGLVTKVTISILGFKDDHTYSLKLQLRPSSGTTPSDTITEESTTTITFIAETWTDYEFTFAGSAEIADDTDYWIVAYRTGASYAINFKRDSPVSGKGAYDQTGEAPWSTTTIEMNIKVEGELPAAGFSKVGAIIG